jgi:RNA polymerase sigma factor
MEKDLSLEDRVAKAKGDNQELNQLIQDYKPFIASIAQNRAGRYLNYGVDEELSIGMMAFKEAIDHYDQLKGKFLSFAKHVIDVRLIDFYRKNKRINREFNANVELEYSHYEERIDKNQLQYDALAENQLRKMELIAYRDELADWDISMEQLIKVSPKQRTLRETYKNIAGLVLGDECLLDILMQTKRLPLKQIEEQFDIHRKKLERGRIYIIALIIALKGSYEFIQEYIDWR